MCTFYEYMYVYRPAGKTLNFLVLAPCSLEEKQAADVTDAAKEDVDIAEEDAAKDVAADAKKVSDEGADVEKGRGCFWGSVWWLLVTFVARLRTWIFMTI